MNRRKFVIVLLGSLVLASLAFPKAAYAYLDPGSGSYILQLILAGLLAASFAVKSVWRNIKCFIANLFSKKQKDEKSTR